MCEVGSAEGEGGTVATMGGDDGSRGPMAPRMGMGKARGDERGWLSDGKREGVVAASEGGAVATMGCDDGWRQWVPRDDGTSDGDGKGSGG